LEVTVKFVGPVKNVVGETERVVTLKKWTVQELLEAILKLYPEQKKKLAQAGAFIRGAIVKHSEIQSPMLREGDVLSLIMPITGG
jgi:molybdopterin converting factor small subunit